MNVSVVIPHKLIQSNVLMWLVITQLHCCVSRFALRYRRWYYLGCRANKKICSSLLKIRGAVTLCSTGCCWIGLSSRWSCRMTKVRTLTSRHWRILTWRTLSGCESCDFLSCKNVYMEQISLSLHWRMRTVFVFQLNKTCAQQFWLKYKFLFKFRERVTGLVHADTSLLCMSSCLQASQWEWS